MIRKLGQMQTHTCLAQQGYSLTGSCGDETGDETVQHKKQFSSNVS